MSDDFLQRVYSDLLSNINQEDIQILTLFEPDELTTNTSVKVVYKPSNLEFESHDQNTQIKNAINALLQLTKHLLNKQ